MPSVPSAVSAAASTGRHLTSESGFLKYESSSKNAMVTTFASSEVTHSGSNAMVESPAAAPVDPDELSSVPSA